MGTRFADINGDVRKEIPLPLATDHWPLISLPRARGNPA